MSAMGYFRSYSHGISLVAFVVLPQFLNFVATKVAFFHDFTPFYPTFYASLRYFTVVYFLP